MADAERPEGCCIVFEVFSGADEGDTVWVEVEELAAFVADSADCDGAAGDGVGGVF